MANYKAADCMSVCPAGEDVIGTYLADRQQHVAEVVRPLMGPVRNLETFRRCFPVSVAVQRWNRLCPLGSQHSDVRQ